MEDAGGDELPCRSKKLRERYKGGVANEDEVSCDCGRGDCFGCDDRLRISTALGRESLPGGSSVQPSAEPGRP